MSPAGSMISPAEVRAAAAKRFARDARTWASLPASVPRLEMPLHPPTQASALRLGPEAPAWTAVWRDPGFAAEVTWETRNWSSLGAQEVPVRCALEGAAAIAEAAGTSAAWRVLEQRADELRQRWGGRGEASDAALADAVRREAPRLGSLDDLDFRLLLAVLEWVAEHPTSGFFVRQLPIHGIHTKWIEEHRRLVLTFVGAVTGLPSMGLADTPSTIRMRVLDPALRPDGLTDVSAPVADLSAMTIRPSTIFVFENLQSVLAMPEMHDAVVLHGNGYAVGRLGGVPWIRESRILYWGDLDSNGFAILDQLRHSCPHVESILMDHATLDGHLDLVGIEATPNKGTLTRLTAEEAAVHARLAREGDLRLEQERVEWASALSALRRAVR